MNCKKCGIHLIVPTWKWCEEHDPNRRKGNTQSATEGSIYFPEIKDVNFWEIIKLYKLPYNVTYENLRYKNILLVDGFEIIGWK